MKTCGIETRIVIAWAALALASGCAHSMMRGSVAMKSSADEAHVCLGDNEVRAGDKVALFKNECGQSTGNGKGVPGCKKVKLGDGTVERTFNEHYSLVKVDPGVPFQEGTIVEKD